MSDYDVANMEDQRLGGEYTIDISSPARLPPERSAFVYALSDRLKPGSPYQKLIRQRTAASMGLQEAQKHVDHWVIQRDKWRREFDEINAQLREIP